jgi:hypothetical protein
VADQLSGGNAPFEDFSAFDAERLRKAISGDPASLRRSGDAFEKVREKLTDAHDRLHQQAGKLQNALQGPSGDRFQSYCDAVLENNERVTTALQDGQYQRTLSHAGSEAEHARTQIAALLITYSKATVLGVVLKAASGHSPALAAVAGVAEGLAQGNLRKARTRLEGMATMLQSTGSQLRPLHDSEPTAQHGAPTRSGPGANQQHPPDEHASGGSRGDHQSGQQDAAGHQQPDRKETEQQKREQKHHAAQARQDLGQKSQAAVHQLQNSPSGAGQSPGAGQNLGSGDGADRGGHEHGASGQGVSQRTAANQDHPAQQDQAQQNRGQNQQDQSHGKQDQSGGRSAAAQQASRAAQQAGTAMSASLNGAGRGTSRGSSASSDTGAPTKAKSRSAGGSSSPSSPQRGGSSGDHRPRTESDAPNDSTAARKTAQEAQQQLQSMRGGPHGASGPASAAGAGQTSSEPPPPGAGSGGAGLADFLSPGGGSSPATGGDGGASLAASGEASAPSAGGSLGGSAATAGLGADATAPGPQPPEGPQPSGGGGSAGMPSSAAGGSGSGGVPMMPPMGGMGATGGGGGAGGGGGRERQTWLSADDGTWDDEHTPGSHVLGRDSETS